MIVQQTRTKKTKTPQAIFGKNKSKGIGKMTKGPPERETSVVIVRSLRRSNCTLTKRRCNSPILFSRKVSKYPDVPSGMKTSESVVTECELVSCDHRRSSHESH